MKEKKMGGKIVMAIAALSVAGCAIYQLPYVYSTFYDPFLEAFGVTNKQLGTLMTIYTVGCMLTYIPGGIIADKIRPKKLLLVSMFSTAILAAILAFSMNYITAAIVWFLMSLSTSFLFWGTILKALRILGDKDNSGGAYGWYYALSSLLSFLSIALQVYVFGALEDNASRAMFWVIMIIGITSALSGVLVWMFYKEDKEAFERIGAEEQFSFKDLPSALKNPYIWGASILMFCMWSINGGISYFTPYLTSQIGIEVTDSALLANVRSYLLLLLCPIGGYIADKLLKSTLKFYAIGYIVLIGLFACVMFIPMGQNDMTLAITLSMITSAVTVMMYGIMWSILNEINIPVKYAATAVGIASVIAYAPDLFMYTLFGEWLDTYGDGSGYFRIFLTLGLVAVFACVLSLVLASKAKKMREKEEEAA